MSQSWQDKIRRHEQKQAEKQRVKEEAERARWRTEEEARKAREAAEYQRKLAQHQQLFRCHICGKGSDGPVISKHQVMVSREYGPHTNTTVHWDWPTGLDKCKFCKKWVCSYYQRNCSYNNICRRCAERL